MIRVTGAMIFGNIVNQMQQQLNGIMKTDQQLSTGLKVNAPSDDPIAYSQILSDQNLIAQSNQYIKNTQQGLTLLNEGDSVLGTAANLISQAKGLAEAQATATATAATRSSAGAQVDQIIAQMVQVGNTKVGDQYIFAGYVNGTAPFDASGNYSGDSNQLQIEISPGVKVPVTLSGNTVFKSAGGIDVFGVLSSLSTALKTNDVAGIQSAVGTLDTALGQLTDSRAQIGALSQRLQSTQGSLQALQTNLTQLQSNLGNVDIAQATSALLLQQQALSYAQAAAARIMQTSLLNYIQ